ncbi:MAG: hypothetical protein U1F25_02260 [Rubrivivax sp.]
MPRATRASSSAAICRGIVGELERIHGQLARNRDLFAPDTLCVPSRLTAKLKDLARSLEPVVKAVLPKYSGHFFMAYTLNASAAAGAGVQAGYAVVTDYKGAVGVYVYLGPAVVTNASLGDSVGVQFYPQVTLDDFEGWGWGFAFSGGPPTKAFGGGIEVDFDVAKPVGLGLSGSLGLGALPVDGSVAATHSWKLWSQR